jgi:hypothetical protein
MLLPTVLLALQVAQGQPVYNGRQHALEVHIPRIDTAATIDGLLDEPVWSRAALLTGFSQYMPADGQPAQDSTEVLVWYAPHGIYFGIRAYEMHGPVNATLADRDRIDTDDYVQILLDTFNDRRRALVLGVNPLGVQADGIRTEGSYAAAGGPAAGGHFENVDMNPDFVFDSKGRVTDFGYEVEVYIPFKSIRYQSTDPQTWAINILRTVQHSGYQDSWVPARRANASFLAQSGTLVGLTGLKRGLVLDVNPFATGKAIGAPDSTTGGWRYDTSPEFGFNARWGMTTNLTLDGTVNPDFSQVEADVGQVTVNERFAVYYPEKRPFFLEGIEQFDTPNQLIYMRRIQAPITGAKLAGKTGRVNIGLLTAVDDKPYSATGTDYPAYALARLRTDIGQNSSIGATYTGKLDGDNYNHVASADIHLVFAKLYFFEAQIADAFTRTGGVSRAGPLWELTADRTGRYWGFHYTLKGIHPDFDAQSGFVPRTGIVNPTFMNRFTEYGARGSLLENWTMFLRVDGIWDYHEFFDGKAPLETNVGANNFFTLRGGWSLGVSPSWNTSAFDPTFYSQYYVATPSGTATDTVSFTVPGRVNGVYAVTASASTPQFPSFAASVSTTVGKDIAYYEPSRANSLGFSATLTWRPTDKLRTELRYTHSQLNRERDGTRYSTANIPRVKIEYQVARPLFIRFVGQYDAQTRDALRDPRTDQPILLRDPTTGTYTAAGRTVQNDLRVDFLLSYRPTPGTVVFFGYGSSYTETDAFRFSDVRRVTDGFFAKVSYLLRM